jgi:hypothetical protein
MADDVIAVLDAAGVTSCRLQRAEVDLLRGRSRPRGLVRAARREPFPELLDVLHVNAEKPNQATSIGTVGNFSFA